jgi:hypothetical protein
VKRRIRNFIAISAALAVLSVTGCSATTSATDAKTEVSLPEQWQTSTVKWESEGDVENIVTLPDKIAYTVGSTFFIFDEKGEAIVSLGQPRELKDSFMIIVDTAQLDGKTYLTVTQNGSYSDTEVKARGLANASANVITGFDQDGKQLFRKVYSSTVDGKTLNPVTGDVRMEPMHVVKDGKGIAFEAAVNGVQVSRVNDPETEKFFLSDGVWKAEIASDARVSVVGGYLRVSNVEDGKATVQGESFCRILDPHTGKFIDENGKLGTACNELVSTDQSSSGAITFRNNGFADKGVNGVMLPKENKTRVFDREEFTPLSIDADGTIYGVLKTKDADVVASADIDSTDVPTPVKNAQRPPIAITSNGIAAFSTDSIAGVKGPMVFAVKQ